MLKHATAFLFGTTVLLGGINPTQVSAGPATGNATEWTQLLNNAELAKLVGLEGQTLAKNAQMLTAQLEQLQTQINTYQTILRNTAKLSENFLAKAMEPVRQLQGIAAQAQSLARDAASLDDFLRSDLIKDPLFKAAPLNDLQLSERYDAWQKEWTGSVEALLRSSNLTMKDVESEGALIDTISSRFASADGHMQALQISNELTGSLARQMNQLRGLTSMQAQQTSVAWGRVLSQMDAEEAARRQFQEETDVTIRSMDSQPDTGRSLNEIFGIGQ